MFHSGSIYPAPFSTMNRDYLVKLVDKSDSQNVKSSLVGVYGLISCLGEELAAKALKRAQNAKSQKNNLPLSSWCSCNLLL